MHGSIAERAPEVHPWRRLSAADRALMQAVAEREWAQGKITAEEYQDILDRCAIYPGAVLVQKVLRLAGRGGVARFPFGQPTDPALRMLAPRTESIPVSSIIGSADRAAYLDRRFQSIHGGRVRLLAIREAMAAQATFPPIEVYRLDGACYVIDGHHRVAAALRIGQLYLDAIVIECWPIWAGGPRSVEAARLAFAGDTGLHMLNLATPERYLQALKQIHEHRWYLGERRQIVSLAEAAQDWYRVEYLPALQQLIAAGLAPSHRLGETGERYFELCALKERMGRERGRQCGFADAVQLRAAHQPWRFKPLLWRRPEGLRPL